MKRPIALIGACTFIIFFITIIIIADRGEGDRWWAFINKIPYGDKLGHVVLIGSLSLLCNLAIPARPPGKPGYWITFATLILFVMLSLEELAQAFIPTRTCDLFDWLADLVGLALGQLAASCIDKFRRRITQLGKPRI